MTIKRITISVPEDLAEKIKDAAGDKPVSAWVTALIERELDEERLDRLWDEWVDGLGLEPEHYEWADRVLNTGRIAETGAA